MVLLTRLEGWLTNRRTRLAHSWGAFTYRNWVRRRRLAERVLGPTDQVGRGGTGVRRYRFKYWVDDLRERLADWSWAREERRAGRSAGRSPRGSEPRAPTLAVASLFVVLTVAVGIGIRLVGGTSDPTKTYSPTPTIDAASGMDVPDVRGMSAPEARALLQRAGLRFERAVAAEGTPGRVLWTLPSIGRSVSSGTPVTLIVGVEAERLVAGLVSSLSSAYSSTSP
jgi:hypothetical protein